MKLITKLIVPCGCIALFGACGDDGGGTPAADATPATIDATATGPDAMLASMTLTLSDLTNLPNLGTTHVYEGWVKGDGAPVSTGRFSVSDTGVMTPATSVVAAADVTAADTFILTIEPVVGDVAAPADTHILAGALATTTAALTTDHAAALGSDFSTAAGVFQLLTPTTGDGTLSGQGIWFITAGKPNVAGLTLPVLPAGWVYEGWVVEAAGPTPTSTGRFTDPALADDDLAGPAKGATGNGPPFPGQDFINPAKILTVGHNAVISVEPEPDNAPGPFVMKPLVLAPIADSAGLVTPQALANVAAGSLPSATATFVAN